MCSAKNIWVLLLLLGVAPSVGAQQSQCATSTVVNARDKQGRFVSSLGANDFRAKLDGKNGAILSFTSGTGARRVVIVLNKSWRNGETIVHSADGGTIVGGSMNGETKRKAMQVVVG